MAVSGVDASVDRKEGVEPSQFVSKEEELSEETFVAGCVTPVAMSGNETPVTVDVVVVIFGRESSEVGDADAVGIVLHTDVTVALVRGLEPTDNV